MCKKFKGGRGGSDTVAKIGVCNHKTKLSSGITFTGSLKVKPIIQIYANVSDQTTPPPLLNPKSRIQEPIQIHLYGHKKIHFILLKKQKNEILHYFLKV